MIFSNYIVSFIILCFFIISPLPLSIYIISKIENNKYENPLHNIITIVLFWCVIHISIGLVLGLTKLLAQNFYIISHSILFFIGLFIGYKKKLVNPVVEQCIGILKIINNLDKVFLALALFLIIYTINIFYLSISTPIDNYDSLAYHLPTMVNWYQTQSLSTWGWELIARYPYNWELLSVVFFNPIVSDAFIIIPNFIIWVVSGIIVYLICKELGSDRLSSIVTSFLIMMMPEIVKNLNTMHIDLPFATFFLISLYYYIKAVKGGNIIYILYSIMAMGVFLGIKTSSIPYLIILLVIISYWLIQKRNETINNHFCNLKGRIVLSMLSLIILGLFWYIRNWIEIGNPLGSVKIVINNVELFPGIIDNKTLSITTLAHLFDFINIIHWKIFFKELYVRYGF